MTCFVIGSLVALAGGVWWWRALRADDGMPTKADWEKIDGR